jgi:hypothetical protein
MQQQIERILAKMKARGLQLNGPIAESALQEFEAKHRIRLPEGFRAFLLLVGNGGVGPAYYGIEPLGLPASDMRAKEVKKWTELPDVGKTFPFTRQWVWEDGDESDEGSREEIDYGSIYIGNDGCAQYWRLIITGPERGNVWQVCGEGMGPADPKRDFLTWYEDWLDGKDSFYGYQQ